MRSKLVFLFLLIRFLVPAQNTPIDSLRTLAGKAKTDSLKILYLNKVGKEFWYINADSSLFYTNAAFKLAREKNIKGLIPYCYNNYGVLTYINGNYSGALKKYFEGLKYPCNNNIKAILYNNIGMSYDELLDLPKAAEYYYKTLEIKKQTGDSLRMATTYNNIGNIFVSQGKEEVAKLYFDTTLHISRKFGDPYSEADALGNIANYYYRKKNFIEAEKYCRQAFELKKKMEDSYGSVTSASDLSAILLNLERYKEALDILLWAEKTCKDNNYQDGLLPIYRNLSQIYEKKGDDNNALGYLKKAMDLKDTLLADGKIREAAVKEKEYAFSIIQVKDSLKNENEKIRTKLNHEKELSVQRLYTYGGIAGCILMLIIAVVIFRAFKDKQKSNTIISQQKKEVERQKDLVEEKQKEIIDSITYAKRIQNALLANHNFLKEHIPDHFIFFNPKDIVSGDFYWATEAERNTLQISVEEKEAGSPRSVSSSCFYLAVCDSTGHGVPGAFMSLLNMGFLSEAINEKSIHEPNKVLNYVRKRLVNSIGKEEQKDGFDGILLCIEKSADSVKVTYAAAHNVPVLISNGRQVELQKDKMPVGKGERKEDFRLFTIDAQEGDMIYLYTDGYADQFGGPNGKKFKYKQLDDLLLSIHRQSMEEQKKNVESAFYNWRGTLEQVDDVLIIGLKI